MLHGVNPKTLRIFVYINKNLECTYFCLKSDKGGDISLILTKISLTKMATKVAKGCALCK